MRERFERVLALPLTDRENGLVILLGRLVAVELGVRPLSRASVRTVEEHLGRLEKKYCHTGDGSDTQKDLTPTGEEGEGESR